MKSPAGIPKGMVPYVFKEEGDEVHVHYRGTFTRARVMGFTMGSRGRILHLKLKSGKEITCPTSDVFTKRSTQPQPDEQ